MADAVGASAAIGYDVDVAAGKSAAIGYGVKPTVSPVIGRVVSAHDVERAVRATIERWQDTYLGELGRQQARDADALPSIRSWNVTAAFSDFPEAQLPSAIVVAPGTASVTRRGTGYEASWAVGVAVVVSAATEADTDQLAKLYAAAVRAMIVQHGTLGGLAEATVWESERFDDVLLEPPDAERTIVAAQVAFAVTVADVVDPAAGVLDPPETDHPRDALERVDVTTARVGIVGIRPPAAIT